VEKKKMLVRTDPRVVMPEGFGQAKPPAAPTVGPKPQPTVVTVDKPVPIKSLHAFMANLQLDQITHFRREKYQPWPVSGALFVCDQFTVPIGTALVLTCVRYRATGFTQQSGGGNVSTYFLHDEALLTYFLQNPPLTPQAIKTLINGIAIASQQFVFADPVGGLADTIIDGYYLLNQNIIPPGYTMQTIATENQSIVTSIYDPSQMHGWIAESPNMFGVEYYGFTVPLTAWLRFKQEYAP